MIFVERHYHKGNEQIIALCKTSKDLYNKCNYVMRKAWFSFNTLPNISELVSFARKEEIFKQFNNSKTATQTIRKLLTDWSNFKAKLVAYKKDPKKFTDKPKPPKYKKHLAQVIFYNETIKRGKNKTPGTIIPTNECFLIKSEKEFNQVIITPKTFGFIIEVQYENSNCKKIKPKQKKESKKVKNRFCSIDLGVNNLATLTSDQHEPLLINGRIVKSINQYYNKKPNKKNSKKRYWRIENYFHHVSKLIVQNCLEYKIKTIIIGRNKGWKQNLSLDKKTNQKFNYIPFYKLIKKIIYKAESVGIDVILTEESYTSKASFFNKDDIPAYNKKNSSPKFTGKRLKRGLYRSNNLTINADVNGSLNIGRKVIGDAIYKIVDRSVVATPVQINPLKFFHV